MMNHMKSLSQRERDTLMRKIFLTCISSQKWVSPFPSLTDCFSYQEEATFLLSEGEVGNVQRTLV